jgi:hypothetical protein
MLVPLLVWLIAGCAKPAGPQSLATTPAAAQPLGNATGPGVVTPGQHIPTITAVTTLPTDPTPACAPIVHINSVVHDNGLGGTFEDSIQLGTHSPTQATEACTSYGGDMQYCAPARCGTGPAAEDVITYHGVRPGAAWAYDGPAAGHVAVGAAAGADAPLPDQYRPGLDLTRAPATGVPSRGTDRPLQGGRSRA